MDHLSTHLQSTVIDNTPKWLSPDFLSFFGAMVLLWVIRVGILKGLTCISRTNYAEQYRITRKPLITDSQLERESVWVYGFFYDFVAFLTIYYLGFFREMSFFVSESVTYYLIFHVAVVEMAYYWLHRFLHWSWVYKMFHQYHHKSINTEPTTGLSFEITERLTYTVLFTLTPIFSSMMGYQCYATLFVYFIIFDVLNEGGHINFEIFPDWYFKSPLKWILYSPTFHSLHHTKFKKNYSLFMPWTDLVFGTAINQSIHETEEVLPTHIKGEKKIDFVLLVHAGYLASCLYSVKMHPNVQPIMKCQHKYQHQPWMYLFYPYLIVFTIYMGYFVRGFHNEENFDFTLPRKNSKECAKSATGSTWIVQNLGAHYLFKSMKKTITSRIEDAILEAQKQGVKVVGLGNFNKAEWINHGGLDIVAKYKDKLHGTYISHGDTLSAATVYQYSLWLRDQKYWRKSVFITGATSKIGRALCLQMIKKNITVYMYSQSRARYNEIASEAPEELRHLLVYSNNLAEGKDCDLWLTGKMIPKGKELLNHIPQNATIVNFAVPDPLTPQLMATRHDLLHLDSGLLQYDINVMSPKFTWLLPSGSIYACLAGCIVHTMLGIEAHEVGPVVIEDMDKYWYAALELGFTIPPASSFYTPITLPSPKLV